MDLEPLVLNWPDLIFPPINLYTVGEVYMQEKDPFDKLDNPEFSKYIHISKYAKWLELENRRETWDETVCRYVDFFHDKLELDDELSTTIYNAIYNLEVMPSMRALMTAGPALSKCNVPGYNCAYIGVDDPKVFDEIMYILMCGTGVGFSVERQYIANMPVISQEFYKTETTIIPHDSRIGWVSGLRELISLLYSGKIPKWDFSKIRPAGARLKTFGGRASGPGPLDDLFKFTIELFKQAAGRKLNSLECHDLVCKIAEVVIVGSVRRSALISLSNFSDDRMRTAKSGEWWKENVQRALSNNSVAYTEKPEIGFFMREWLSLYDSKSGERGIFNRVAANNLLPERRAALGYEEWGCNPCSEIVLRASGQMCNLTEVIVRPEDTLETLLHKLEIATIMGTFQSTLTDFRYLRPQWAANCKEERLLGVSLTGIMDHAVLSGSTTDSELKRWLTVMKQKTIDTNEEWADILEIERSTAITAVKPSGCRPINELVTTKQGIYTLEDLMHNSDEKWGGIKGISTDYGAGNITKTFKNGKAKVTRIKMSYGMEVVSTSNHKWFRKDDDFIETKDLQVGDILDVNIGIYTSEVDAELKPLDLSEIKITQPEEVTPEFSWLLGYLWGDGCMSEHKWRVRWTADNIENLVKVNNIMKSLFNIEGKIHPASEGTVLEIGNKELWFWLLKNGIYKYTDDGLANIPKVIRESSRESIIAFISGFFDAYTPGVVLPQTGYRLPKHIQDVAATVGLVFGRSHNIKGKQKVKSMYLMTLCTGHSDLDSLETFIKYSNKITGDLTITDCSRSKKLGKIESIEQVEEEVLTFDVETDEHWFYAGAITSHNTVSLLNSTASGIHPRYSDYYVRTVRGDNKDPLTQMMIDQGISNEPDVTKPDSTTIFSFPMKSPENSITRDDRNALEQLEIWKKYQLWYCEHKPSITVYVREHEWLAVGAWVYENFDIVSGVSFLPHTEHTYKQAPYQEIDEEEYLRMIEEKPVIEWTELVNYETVDTTDTTKELACTSGDCEL